MSMPTPVYHVTGAHVHMAHAHSTQCQHIDDMCQCTMCPECHTYKCTCDDVYFTDASDVDINVDLSDVDIDNSADSFNECDDESLRENYADEMAEHDGHGGMGHD